VWVTERRLNLREGRVGYYFVLPATVLLMAVIIIPAIHTFRLSISTRSGRLITAEHYLKAISDPVVRTAFANTLIIAAISVFFFVLIGLGIALFLNRPMKGRSLLRIVALLPWTLPDVTAGLIWRWIYNPTYGVLNDVLSRLGVLKYNIEWLSSPKLAMFSIILTNIWRGYPFVMVILLAGLQSIPKELYECASTDGANAFTKFLHITIPGLKKPLIVSLVLSTIWEFRRFGLVSILTGGGPGYSTEIMPILIFRQYFKFFKFEYASSVAIMLTLLLILISIPYIKGLLREA
jgi:multiple sugar transport system permease protein